MELALVEEQSPGAIPVVPLSGEALGPWLETAAASSRRWVEACGFNAKPDSHCLVPDGKGGLSAVLAGIQEPGDPFALARLCSALPPGNYFLESDWDAALTAGATVGWALGGYRFTRYKANEQKLAKLVIDPRCDAQGIKDQVNAVFLVRDLVNTPAEDMMPEHLSEAVKDLAHRFDVEVTEFVGDALVEKNYPAIHTVGRASTHAPRLIDLQWGDTANPRLTLVGKGVCFDTGGLDLKPSSNMRLMKKDMGGAAHAIGLANLVMCADLPVRLRLLVPAVDNAVSGSAYRPGDVLMTRKGLSVEIDNTDAEGRVILCDALAEGASEQPDLMLDFATLTGAARVALGTDVPALFCNDDRVAEGLVHASQRVHDPVWRMPLYAPYKELLNSEIADLANAASKPFGGAITAALFLQAFVPSDVPWAHFDIMAWNLSSRPGRPQGGEAMGLRATFEYLRERYCGQ